MHISQTRTGASRLFIFLLQKLLYTQTWRKHLANPFVPCPDTHVPRLSIHTSQFNALQRWALYGIWCPLYVSSHRYIIYALAYTFSLKRKPFGGSGPSALLSAAVLDRALLSAGLLLLWTCHPAARLREYSLKAALEKLITVTPRNGSLVQCRLFLAFFSPDKVQSIRSGNSP